MNNSFPKDISKYKLIVSDFDGTLAGVEHVTTPKVQKAVKKWMSTGRFFTIATGRQFLMLDDECRKIGLTSPVVVRGGAEVVTMDGQIIHSEYMTEEDVNTILDEIKKSRLFNIAIEDGAEIFIDFEIVTPFPKLTMRKPEEFKLKSIPKVHIKPKNDDIRKAEKFVKYLTHSLPNVHGIATHNNKFGYGWDITSVKATKLHGIVKVMEALGLSRDEIVGVGDSYNDFPLLEAAGLKVAMGNAHQELKEVADIIVPSHEEDGVAYLLNKLLE